MRVLRGLRVLQVLPLPPPLLVLPLVVVVAVVQVVQMVVLRSHPKKKNGFPWPLDQIWIYGSPGVLASSAESVLTQQVATK